MVNFKTWPIFIWPSLIFLGTYWCFPLHHTHDSGVYLLGAKSIYYFGMYHFFDGHSNQIYPPLFSISLIPAYLFSINPLLWAKIISSCYYVVSTNLLLFSFRNGVVSRHSQYYTSLSMNDWILAFAIHTSTAFMADFMFLWSEAQFIFFTFLGLMLLQKFLINFKSILYFVSILILCLAYLTRTVGIFALMLPYIALFVAYYNKSISLKKSLILSLSGFTLIGLAFCIWSPWQAASAQQAVHIFPLDYNYPKVFGQIFNKYWDDFIPFTFVEGKGFLAAVASMVLIIMLIIKEKFNVWAWFAVCYFLGFMLLYGFKLVYMPDDAHRYASPIMPIIALFIVQFMCKYLKNIRFLWFILILFFSYRIIRLVKNGIIWHNYSDPISNHDIRWKQNGKTKIGYSTRPDVDNVYYRIPIYYLPKK